MRLYELGREYLALLELANDSDDEDILLELFNKLDGDISEKLDGIADILTELDADSEKIKIEVDRLAKRRKVIENNTERIKKMTFNFMKISGIEKQKTLLHTFNIAKNPPKFVIYDDALIPADYYDIEQIRTLNKERLKNAVKRGEIVDLCGFEQGERLNIK